MKLIKALLESLKKYNTSAIRYKEEVYFHDPYEFEKRGEAGKLTEFRTGMGGFGEFLLWNHGDFAPKYNDYFIRDKEDNRVEKYPGARLDYDTEKIRNMFECKDFESYEDKR